MTLTNTPLRLLVKTYANGLIDRSQYLEVRQQLLKKLSSHGELSHEDLQNFLSIFMDTEEDQQESKQYSFSDWIIIVLGLMAAVVLAFVLYS